MRHSFILRNASARFSFRLAGRFSSRIFSLISSRLSFRSSWGISDCLFCWFSSRISYRFFCRFSCKPSRSIAHWHHSATIMNSLCCGFGFRRSNVMMVLSTICIFTSPAVLRSMICRWSSPQLNICGPIYFMFRKISFLSSTGRKNCPGGRTPGLTEDGGMPGANGRMSLMLAIMLRILEINILWQRRRRECGHRKGATGRHLR